MIINKSSRQLSQYFKFLLHLISIAFAFFLLQAGSLIIEYIPQTGVPQTVNDFVNQEKIESIDNEIDELGTNLELLNVERMSLLAQHDGMNQQYDLEKENYKSMLSSRFVTEDGRDNEKVKEARLKLSSQADSLKNIKMEVSKYEIKIAEKKGEIKIITLDKENIFKVAREEQESSERMNTFKSFAVRLCFVLPLLILSIIFYRKYGNSNYWPFVYGWGYFSLYAFFIELVPYLPSYGGYVRALVGIVLCFLIGKYLIRRLNNYLEQKKVLESEDETERRQQLQDKESNLEKAFDKINKEVCPSCDRKFIDKNNKYCVFCGLCIKTSCIECDTLQISFNKYCQECGVTLDREKMANTTIPLTQ